MDIFHDVERMMHLIGMTTTGDSEKEVYWYTEQIRMSAEQLEESLTSDSPCEVIDSVLDVIHANIGLLLSLGISPEGCKKMFDAKMDYTHRENDRNAGTLDITRKENITRYIVRIKEIWAEGIKEDKAEIWQ